MYIAIAAILLIVVFLSLIFMTNFTERFYEDNPGFLKRISNAIVGTSISKTANAKAVSKPSPPKNLTYEQARQQYLKEYPGVKKAGVDPWDHYVNNGKREGRQWRGKGKPPAPRPQAPAPPKNLTYDADQ